MEKPITHYTMRTALNSHGYYNIKVADLFIVYPSITLIGSYYFQMQY
ncbi:hypothetical protein GGR21_001431 [Dysgonomonas hofstadii]|uniref:Uncharacterized protein n=1 Tax=Dysgonomonas hofstadii TaxID=637886 RepID=A0A840CNA2_9BACT|nr:hypothetical protein [Dysgonomonas hofstadii]